MDYQQVFLINVKSRQIYGSIGGGANLRVIVFYLGELILNTTLRLIHRQRDQNSQTTYCPVATTRLS